MKKVFIDTTQYCEEARLNTQRLKNLVRFGCIQNDFIYTDKIEQADLILYYACGHLERHEVESVRTLKRILSLKKPSSRLIVWGCLSKINPNSMEDIYDGPLIGPEESWDYFCSQFNLPKNMLASINANTLNIRNKIIELDLSLSERIFSSLSKLRYKLRLGDYQIEDIRQNKTWYIKIVSGCKYHCTFCSDILAYKKVQSQSIENIIEQFELGLKKGYRYFFFMGRDLGSYGYDIDQTLTDLLKEIIKRYPTQDYKIFLVNISPHSLINMYSDLEQIFLSGKIFEIGSHIQSGSEKILKLMGKTLSLNEWVKIMKKIEKKHPEIRLGTSIMVGFPGETEQDFRHSVSLLNNILFDRVAVYKYEERPNLPSLKLNSRVPEEIKKRRYNEMFYYATLCITKKRVRKSQFFRLPILKLLFALVKKINFF